MLFILYNTMTDEVESQPIDMTMAQAQNRNANLREHEENTRWIPMDTSAIIDEVYDYDHGI